MPAPSIDAWMMMSRGSPEISSYIARAASALVFSGCLRTSLPSATAFFTAAGLMAFGGWAGVAAGGAAAGVSVFVSSRLMRSPLVCDSDDRNHLTGRVPKFHRTHNGPDLP